MVSGTVPMNRIAIMTDPTPPHGRLDSLTIRHFPPGQHLPPVGQKLNVGVREFLLPSGPRDLFHLDPAGDALNAAHPVAQKHAISPHRHELELALLQTII